ncbi:2-dehydropantoate 2-reductase [hydrothermal vent metagenome]|uniref:2-dehydropantoate 2-reductase n=1 Tax=hydrothermal vent metagenome TaxID=652676 RepID=A0A3B0SSF4_9ZZZZ
MSQRQRYAIIGTGALGGLYGAMLARGGHEVHFLLRSDFDHVTKHGLKIESHLGDFELSSVNTHATVDSMPACDVTIVALKTTQNRLLEELLTSPTRDGGVVLVLQNGLDVEADSAAVVGADRVLGGTCFLCTNKVGPGHIRHIDYGRIVFGNYSGALSPAAVRIAEEMVTAGIDANATDDLLLTRWRKLMWNIPFNGLSVALDATTKQLVDDPHAVALIEKIIQEVHGAAAASGIEIPETMIDKTIDSTRTMIPYDSSMRIDYLNRRPMEIEAIFGNPLRAAKKVGAEMPRVEMLYQQLKFIEAMRCDTC